MSNVTYNCMLGSFCGRRYDNKYVFFFLNYAIHTKVITHGYYDYMLCASTMTNQNTK